MIILKDKVAVVTGASSEMGKAICKALAECGAKVVIHYYKNREGAMGLLNDIENGGGDAFVVQADIRAPKEVNNLFNKVISENGAVDILVNNAHGKIFRNSFIKTTWEEHQAQLDVITKGSYFCIQESLKVMLKQHQGSIINILNSQINSPVKGYSSFTMAISAMVGITRNLAREVGNSGVRVNMIVPGYTVTDKSENAPINVRDKIIGQTPLNRLAVPEDIAKAVLFFASNLSSFITGSYLVVDGGLLML